MSVERIFIVGAGQGGFQAAASLRQEGFGGRITLIGAEPHLPYQRPPLSKAYLKTGDGTGLELRPEAFFRKNGIELVLGAPVEEIDRKAGAVLTRGRRHGYDHLILATGTRNARPPIAGVERAHDLRTLDEARRLREALARPRRCAVIGGGFIGLEFAAVARALGHAMTVCEAADRLMPRVVSPAMSARFLELHRGLGTDVRLCAPLVAIDAPGVVLESGERIAADLVLLAVGVRPNTELAEAAGLACDNGFVVDRHLATADPAISAIGDCAVFPDPRTGRPVRLESVQAAVDHARAVARRLVGGADDPYAAVPWFWSDQADAKLQIAGLAAPGDEDVVRADGTVFRFSGDVLTAVETVNEARTHMATRRLLARGDSPGRAEIEAAGFDMVALAKR